MNDSWDDGGLGCNTGCRRSKRTGGVAAQAIASTPDEERKHQIGIIKGEADGRMDTVNLEEEQCRYELSFAFALVLPVFWETTLGFQHVLLYLYY